MPNELHGQLQIARDHKFAIVIARFNEFITSRLLGGALDAIKRHGGSDDQITVAWVPGSFEVPLVARKLAASKKFHAVICLAAVIRGQTDHYEHVCQQITRGVGEVGQATGTPTIFGVITCDTIEQAIDRAGAKGGNLGFNAAITAIEMANLIQKIDAL